MKRGESNQFLWRKKSLSLFISIGKVLRFDAASWELPSIIPSDHSYVSLLSLSSRFGPYFIEPVIAGLSSENEPFIAATDLIGCLNFAEDFVVSGTASDKLFGMAEGLWEPDLVSASIGS